MALLSILIWVGWRGWWRSGVFSLSTASCSLGCHCFSDSKIHCLSIDIFAAGDPRKEILKTNVQLVDYWSTDVLIQSCIRCLFFWFILYHSPLYTWRSNNTVGVFSVFPRSCFLTSRSVFVHDLPCTWDIPLLTPAFSSPYTHPSPGKQLNLSFDVIPSFPCHTIITPIMAAIFKEGILEHNPMCLNSDFGLIVQVWATH